MIGSRNPISPNFSSVFHSANLTNPLIPASMGSLSLGTARYRLIDSKVALFSPPAYQDASALPIVLFMHLHPSSVPGSTGDPASHLQFQISLLRLMSHKTMDQEDRSKVGLMQVPSSQITELERLERPRRSTIRLKTRT